ATMPRGAEQSGRGGSGSPGTNKDAAANDNGNTKLDSLHPGQVTVDCDALLISLVPNTAPNRQTRQHPWVMEDVSWGLEGSVLGGNITCDDEIAPKLIYVEITPSAHRGMAPQPASLLEKSGHRFEK
ncbi:hypothetical protein THAOC_06274, partial [Thalassiosira oceanica]